MKVAVLFILILFTANNLKAQKSLNHNEVDTATYNAYLNSNWDKVIDIANTAIKQDIDFYYLRMRLAYAYFMNKRYTKAIPHYLKALEYNTKDEIALKYLYYSYKYCGRKNDAEKLIGQFSTNLKSTILNTENKLKSIGFYVSYGFGSNTNESTKNTLIEYLQNSSDGTQLLSNNSKEYSINLSHRIWHSIIVRHDVHLLYKDVFMVGKTNDESYNYESQTIRQFNYNLAAEINLAKGFTITPLYSFINYRIPDNYTTGMSFGNSFISATFEKYNQSVFALKASQNFNIFKISIAGTQSNMNLGTQNTAACSFTIFPLSNLNLYYIGNAYYHMQKDEQLSTQQFIHSHKLGVKTLTNLWIETSAIFGGFSNFYDPFSEIAYNGYEKYNSIYGVNIIVPFYKNGISLFAAYRYYQSQSMFVSSDNTLETNNYISFNYQLLTGGISWKF